MRAFLALPIPDETAAALVACQGAMQFGRPVPEENLHVTVAFLGNVDATGLDELDLELSARALPAAWIDFGEIGHVTDSVHISVQKTDALSDLHARARSAARGAMLALPRRRFRPHVTLVRGRRLDPARLAPHLGRPPVAVPGFQATTLALFRSELHPDGARYERLAEYALGPAPGRGVAG